METEVTQCEICKRFKTDHGFDYLTSFEAMILASNRDKITVTTVMCPDCQENLRRMWR